MNIQYGSGNEFVFRERAYSMRVNSYFGPIQTNVSHATPNYGPEKSNIEVDYYRQKYCSPEK